MSTSDKRLKSYMQLERKRRGWTQTDLGKVVGLSKTSIVEFEGGRHLGLGNESAIEEALGWRIGSLDRIRAGLEPIPLESRIPTPEELAEMPVAEVLRIIQRVRETQGDAAARHLKANFYGYMERATESKPEVQR